MHTGKQKKKPAKVRPRKAPDMPAKNLDRAAYAEKAMRFFGDSVGMDLDHEGFETVVGDFICDLRHLCDSREIDLLELIDRKAYHYKAEAFCSMCHDRLTSKDSADEMDNACRHCEKKLKG